MAHGGLKIQPTDPTLVALAALDPTPGVVAQTGADTFAKRTIEAGLGVAILNGDGAAGNPSVAIGQSVATTASVTFDAATLTTPLGIASGGTGAATAAAAFNTLSPATTAGDLIYHNGTGNARLPAGTNGHVLTLAAGVPTWATPTVATHDHAATYVDATGDTMTGTLTLAMPIPRLVFTDTDAAVDEQKWDFRVNGNVLNGRYLSDDETFALSWLTVTRTGAASATVALPNLTLGTPLPIGNGGTGQINAVAAFDALAPTTTAGDLIYHNGTDNVRLAAGTNGHVLTLAGGVPTWAALPADSGFNNPMTTAGDLILGGASGAATRLGIGTNSQVLRVVGQRVPDDGADIIVGGTGGAATRLGAGTNGHVLTLTGGTPTWAAATGSTFDTAANHSMTGLWGIGGTYETYSNLVVKGALGMHIFTGPGGSTYVGLGTSTSAGTMISMNARAASDTTIRWVVEDVNKASLVYNNNNQTTYWGIGTGGIEFATYGVAGIHLRIDGNGLNIIRGVAYVWPTAQGAASTVLTNNGSGVLTWSAVTGGSGLPTTGGTMTGDIVTGDTAATPIGIRANNTGDSFSLRARGAGSSVLFMTNDGTTHGRMTADGTGATAYFGFGRIKLGTSATGAPLDGAAVSLHADMALASGVRFYPGVAETSFSFATRGTTNGGSKISFVTTGGTEHMVIHSGASGAVGFVTIAGATLNTAYRLNVNGAALFAGDVSVGGGDLIFTGDSGAAPDTAMIGWNTADAADTKALFLAGGGITGANAGSNVRGGYITLNGNERATNPGTVFILPGTATGAKVSIWSSTAEALVVNGANGYVGVGAIPDQKFVVESATDGTHRMVVRNTSTHSAANSLMIVSVNGTNENKYFLAGMHSSAAAGNYVTGVPLAGLATFETGGGTSGLAFRIGSNTSGDMTFIFNASVRFRLNFAGAAFLGDSSSNAFSGRGLTINQAGNNDEILSLKSANVNHGFTLNTETDTYAYFKKLDASTGGVAFVGVTGSTRGMHIAGYAAGTESTDRSVNANAYIFMNTAKLASSNLAAVSGNVNLLAIAATGAVRFIFDSDGDSHQDVGTTWTNFDAHDDIALLTALSAGVSRRGDPLRERFGSILEANRETLTAQRIVQFNEDGHHFINWSRAHMLTIGAVRQTGVRLWALEEKVEDELTVTKRRVAELEREVAWLTRGLEGSVN